MGVGVEAQVGKTLEQRTDGDARLHPGEVHPETHVGAVPEGDVLLRVTEDVEAIAQKLQASKVDVVTALLNEGLAIAEKHSRK